MSPTWRVLLCMRGHQEATTWGGCCQVCEVTLSLFYAGSDVLEGVCIVRLQR